jgi:hypothetical protein
MERKHADMAKGLHTVVLEPVGTCGELVVHLLKIQIPD